MQNRRKILKVKNKFQDRMILEVILTTFIFINVLVIASFFAIESIHDFFRLKMTLAVALATGEVGGLAIIYYYSLKSSHRIAGPVYMLERRMDELANGNLTASVHLRKGDYFHETGDVFNRCAASLKRKVSDVRATADALSKVDGLNSESKELVNTLLAQLDSFQLTARRESPKTQSVEVEDAATVTPN